MKEEPEALGMGMSEMIWGFTKTVRNIPKLITLHRGIYKRQSGFVLYLIVYTVNRGDMRHQDGILPLDSCFHTFSYIL